jgi:hypothetical protein
MNKRSETQSGSTRPRKFGAALGLTAGLVGGTAAGMVLGVPGLSSAAESPDGPVAIVQQVDDPGTDESGEAREPGTRLREMLQSLVDDGTLTADQADKVANHLVENAPDRGDRGHRGGHGRGGHGRFGRAAASEAVTELLGIDADTLREQLKGGESLADIANASGVDTNTLIDAIVSESQARVDSALEDGKIDADKAADISARIEERVINMVDRTFEGRPGGEGTDADG